MDGMAFEKVDHPNKADLYWVDYHQIARIRKCFSEGDNCDLKQSLSVSNIPVDKQLGIKRLFTEMLYDDPRMKYSEQFYPRTYLLDLKKERENFITELESSYGPSLVLERQCCLDCFESEQKKNHTCPSRPNFWIMKPGRRAKGEGIFLIDPMFIDDLYEELNDPFTLSEIIHHEQYLAQRYISDPFLFEGDRKCSIRRYFLIASIDPLLVLTYPNYRIICGGVEYSVEGGFDDSDVILTNTHVHAKRFGVDSTPRPDIETISEYIQTNNLTHDKNWLKSYNTRAASIISYVSKSYRDWLLSNHPDMFQKGSGFPHFFEIFGLDIILDSKLKMWVTEIQVRPSMDITDVEKRKLTVPMMMEIWQIIFEVQKERLEQENLKFENIFSVTDFEWVTRGEKEFFPDIL